MENHPRTSIPRFLGLPDLINYRRGRIGLIAYTITFVREPHRVPVFNIPSSWSFDMSARRESSVIIIPCFSRVHHHYTIDSTKLGATESEKGAFVDEHV